MATTKDLSNRQMLETRFKNARSNLLFVVGFTVLNIILLIGNANSYFLFSAYIPYALVDIGMFLCGKYPAEYYGEDFLGVEFFDSSVFGVILIISLIIIGLYLISWIFSKNNKTGWMIFALVFFIIDTAVMLLFFGIELDGIIDVVFHAWVIISLVMGINAGVKLKKLPADMIDAPEIQETEENSKVLVNSGIIRIADTDVKARVLLEADALGHTITYRRVKRVNELIIDGKVYDEFEALIETAHSLKAQLDGHLIEVGFDSSSHSYLKIDGQIVVKKMRWF